jgi:hypothetical protein
MSNSTQGSQVLLRYSLCLALTIFSIHNPSIANFPRIFRRAFTVLRNYQYQRSNMTLHSAPTLLGLPSHLRMRILREAGLKQHNTIGFTPPPPPDRVMIPQDRRVSYMRHCPPLFIVARGSLPVSLLRICKLIYTEGINILYSENSFFIDCSNASAVRIFPSLSPSTIRPLRNLVIFFVPGYDRDMAINSARGGFGLRPLPIYHHEVKIAFKQWEHLFVRLSSNCSPNMKVSIYFHASSVQVGQLLLRSLKLFPQLLEVRLSCGDSFWHLPGIQQSSRSYIPEEDSMRISLMAVGDILTRPPTTTRFSFEKLPIELQDMVIFEALVEEDHIYGLVRQHTNADPYIIKQCCGTCGIGEGIELCFCTDRASYSSSCTRRLSRKGLFVVNRSIRYRATRIFYGHNVFEVDARMLRPFLQPSLMKGAVHMYHELGVMPSNRLRFVKRLCLRLGDWREEAGASAEMWLDLKQSIRRPWRTLPKNMEKYVGIVELS